MDILKRLTEKRLSKGRKQVIEYLCAIPPERLIQASEHSAVMTFQRAAQRVPAYKELLSSLKINPAQVSDIASFRRLVPFLDKKSAFLDNKIDQLCLDGNLNEVKSLLTSSGHSGIFSFGVNTLQNLRDSSQSIDLGLDYSFDISNKKTLLINCLPMGVKVNTGLTIAETSVREDMVWAVVKKFSPEFAQTVLVGEGSFLKKIIEDGTKQGINWKSGSFHFIAGEEGIAENYRTYIAELVGIDFQNPFGGMIGSSMGIAELDLNIFHETRDTICLRRLAHSDVAFRHALFGEDASVCPMLFVYYPHRTFVEELPDELGKNQIVISMLSPRMKIPLLRYKTGDYGKILYYHRLGEVLKEFGYEKLMPELKLPLIAINGRRQCVKAANNSIYPEEIKEALYADSSVASSVTGAFKLIQEHSSLSLAVQLKEGITNSGLLREKFKIALQPFTAGPLKITFYPYHAFPYFMELDYERKFKYI